MNNLITFILFLLIIYLLYQQKCIKKSLKENMTSISNVDYEAIKNLGIIAKGLVKGGFTVPGNLNVRGKITTTNTISAPNASISRLNSNLTVNGNINTSRTITASNAQVNRLNNKQPLYVNDEVGISMNRGKNAGTYMGINDNQGFYATRNKCGGSKANLILRIEKPSCF